VKIYSIIILILLSHISMAQQLCRTEEQIPSTAPDSRYISLDDGTIIDVKTELMWAQCPQGRSGSNCESGTDQLYTYEEAVFQTATSTLAGHIDWRLPNIKELSTLIEERCINPAINSNVFPNTHIDNSSSGSLFWSSTHLNLIRFYNGFSFDANNIFESFRVRMVRDLY